MLPEIDGENKEAEMFVRIRFRKTADCYIFL